MSGCSKLEAILLADENFENVTLSISDDSASFTAYAVDHCNRSSEKATELYTTEFSNYPGMDVSVSPTSATSGMSAMGSTGNTTTVMLLGDDNQTDGMISNHPRCSYTS